MHTYWTRLTFHSASNFETTWCQLWKCPISHQKQVGLQNNSARWVSKLYKFAFIIFYKLVLKKGKLFCITSSPVTRHGCIITLPQSVHGGERRRKLHESQNSIICRESFSHGFFGKGEGSYKRISYKNVRPSTQSITAASWIKRKVLATIFFGTIGGARRDLWR